LLSYHAARMDSAPPPPGTVKKLGAPGVTMVKAATVWLCLVALATVLNSVILFKYSRFIDFLIGLSFTQFIDAVFVGMHLEPPGVSWLATALPAWVLDLPFVALVLVLATKVSHRRVRATKVSFWLYAIDTFVLVLSFAASLAVFHAAVRQLAWQGLTLIFHTIGLFILFRAWRAAVGAQSLA
jgi:hypothetical protein